MKVCYRNEQIFDVTGRFSVAQRKLGWEIRSHPKKYCTRLGPQWKLHRAYRELSQVPDAELEAADRILKQSLDRMGEDWWSVSKERYRRGHDEIGAFRFRKDAQ